MLWSTDILEYDALKAIVRRFVASPMGKARLDELAPSTDRPAIEETLADTAEALHYVRETEEPIRFGSIPEIQTAAAKLRIEGAVLDPLEIQAIISFLTQADHIRATLQKERDRYPRLAAHADAIDNFSGVLKAVAGKITPEGTVDDNASPELARIRRDQFRQRKSIEASLERFLKTHREDGVLQEDFITQRNDRFVVPLVTNMKGRVAGVVHGASASGHSVFVEPLETIELNNDLVRLNDSELREIHRILRDLSDRLRAERSGIRAAVLALGELDLIFGKAHFGKAFEGTVPRFGDKLALVRARHPLLVDVMRSQRKSVVPLTLTLEGASHTLLISGPNTGGKTVAMKCVGLLALMAQSGLPVPADDAELPLFDQVLADMGDAQSISESLSSFSAHVKRLKELQEAVTPDSLVLVDELGRATDPEEGGALAVALLDDFRAVGALTLVSTHLMAVKVYGSTTGGVVNASMGFNEETLEPTYVLKVGVPGKSAGLDIAQRLGLPIRLIENARSRLSQNDRDIARFLNELNAKVEAATQRERELEQMKRELEQRRARLEEEAAKREARRVRELEDQVEEALAKFQSEAASTIGEIEQQQSADKARLKAAKLKREFTEQVTKITTPQKAAAAPALEIKEGARVRLQGIREIARVRRLIGADALEVEAGFLKLQVPRTDVLEVLNEDGAPVKPKLPKNVSFQPAGEMWSLAQRELNVIGRRAEEALEEVDRYLDSAALASVERVRIVHGHGMGVLKRAVADLLRKHPHVEKFYQATASEGGAGATIVELRV
jgi:DNA mismatch repair protein MutS2